MYVPTTFEKKEKVTNKIRQILICNTHKKFTNNVKWQGTMFDSACVNWC